ncbi:hypothetical protein ACO0QE_001042 [Hanseniaspora vineae]
MPAELVPLGQVIYSCVKPIFKIYLIMGTGFLLAKLDILNGEAIKMISQVVLTVLLPCLSFNKIVANIEDKFIKDVGIIVLSSVLLYGTGFLFGWLVKIFMPCPKRWHGGIICASMFPNISDLPIAYLQTMNNNIIFTQDETDRGTAMVIIFLATFLFSLFNLGGFQLVEMDFKDDLPTKSKDEEAKIESVEAPPGMSPSPLPATSSSDTAGTKDSKYMKTDDNGKNDFEMESNDSNSADLASLDSNYHSSSNLPSTNQPQLYTQHEDGKVSSTETISHHSQSHTQDDSVSATTSARPRRRSLVGSVLSRADSMHSYRNSSLHSNKDGVSSMAGNNNKLIRQYSRVDTMGNPIPEDSLARYLSLQALQQEQQGAEAQEGEQASVRSMNTGFTTAQDNKSLMHRVKSSKLAKMVTNDVGMHKSDIDDSVKALPKKFHFMKYAVFFMQNCLRPCSVAVILGLVFAFIPWVRGLFVTTSNAHIPNAPDGEPPLSFIMDYTSYVGAASVPFGLLLLGATLGNLEIGALYPGFWKSAVVLVLLRQVVMPIFGVLWCERMMKAGWLDKTTDKMVLFVIAINWALPTMTTIIYLTASYTPIDALETPQMDCASFFLLLQYPFLVISLPFLATYFIKVQLSM